MLIVLVKNNYSFCSESQVKKFLARLNCLVFILRRSSAMSRHSSSLEWIVQMRNSSGVVSKARANFIIISFCFTEQNTYLLVWTKSKFFIYKSKEFSFSRNSYKPKCRMPLSSFHGFAKVLLIIIFLKKSFVFLRGRSSVSILAGSLKLSADWI